MASLYSQIELASVPKHIAIIMDGNGRWANEQQKERTYGHKKGVESVREVLKAANKLGVETLTLYTFSEENWNRPEQEVEALMELLVLSLIKELDELKENHIKLSVIGEVNALPTKVQHTLNEALAATADNSASNLVLALNYSGRREILRATNSLLKKGVTEATEELFQNELYLGNALPYPDLLIRTGGEQRVSNFLLWQMAYTEFYFTNTFWPDFGEEELYAAVVEYQSRERRFGKTGAQISGEGSELQNE